MTENTKKTRSTRKRKTVTGRERSSLNAIKNGKWTKSMTIIRKQRRTVESLQNEIMELQKLRLEALDAVIEIHGMAPDGRENEVSGSQKDPDNYSTVLEKLEELRKLCLYEDSGRVRKEPNLHEANRALASEVNALKARKRAAETQKEKGGRQINRSAGDLQKKILEKVGELKEVMGDIDPRERIKE